ncbi:hypothetical protein AZE42_05974 [Rhizopogon vesiculosus]|uniref:Uncharacterized protein n=1 Tax=Rhizopogon vesiculosus TaxID=180088 RepID=A0A1J8Q6S5_9AGAM|nr:hypothetical protein AZE42_05974 [Rhizopogon vesiculosus]
MTEVSADGNGSGKDKLFAVWYGCAKSSEEVQDAACKGLDRKVGGHGMGVGTDKEIFNQRARLNLCKRMLPAVTSLEQDRTVDIGLNRFASAMSWDSKPEESLGGKIIERKYTFAGLLRRYRQAIRSFLESEKEASISLDPYQLQDHMICALRDQFASSVDSKGDVGDQKRKSAD